MFNFNSFFGGIHIQKSIFEESMSLEYNEYLKDIKQYMKAFIFNVPTLRNYKTVLPDAFKTYFTHIEYNERIGAFIFTKKCNPIIAFKFYVNIRKYTSFRDKLKFEFILTKIFFYYQNGKKVSQFQVREGKRFELLNSFFELLNNDQSLEDIYINEFTEK